jgi:hypothetical protein
MQFEKKIIIIGLLNYLFILLGKRIDIVTGYICTSIFKT